MTKGYWIAHVDVADIEKYRQYSAAIDAVLKRFGGSFLVRGGRFENTEGRNRSRHVVIEFPDYQAALDCWNSPDYQAALAIRAPVTSADIVVIEGCE